MYKGGVLASPSFYLCQKKTFVITIYKLYFYNLFFLLETDYKIDIIDISIDNQ